MEIKTTTEIIEELRLADYMIHNRQIHDYSNDELNDAVKVQNEINKKWVAVDELKIWLEKNLSYGTSKSIIKYLEKDSKKSLSNLEQVQK